MLLGRRLKKSNLKTPVAKRAKMMRNLNTHPMSYDIDCLQHLFKLAEIEQGVVVWM